MQKAWSRRSEAEVDQKSWFDSSTFVTFASLLCEMDWATAA
jgi:hypothetical protein